VHNHDNSLDLLQLLQFLMYKKLAGVFTCRLSATGHQEAEQPHCAGNAILPGRVHHTQLAESSVDCDQLSPCIVSLSQQTVFVHVSIGKIIKNITAIITVISLLPTTIPLLLLVLI